MTLSQTIILGLVEGITEFLPISSTAHLIITSTILKLEQTEFVSFFEVFIQSGAILAVVLLYWRTVWENKDLITKIIVSFIPTAIIGLVMRDTIKDVFFQSNELIAWSLILVGIVFMVVEYFVGKKLLKLSKRMTDMSYRDAFLVGIFQSMAIVPGVSRAGAVIIGLMLMKYKRVDAALYSFLLAVPTILGASVFDLIETDTALILDGIGMLVLGSIIAFLAALIFVRWLISYLQTNTLTLFAIYRIVLGLGVLIFLI